MAKAVEILGLDGVEKIFKIIGPKAARRVMKGATSDVARMIRTEAKQNVPVRSGTLKKAIKVKPRRGKPGESRTSVFVETGRKAKNDGFYWHMIERGTEHSPAQPFLRPAFHTVRNKVNTAFTTKIKQRIIKEIKKVS